MNFRRPIKWTYKTVRTIAVSIIALVFGVPALSYVGLSLPFVERSIADVLEKQLSELLQVNVTIGRIEISPFNRVTLSRVVIADTSAMEHGPIAMIDRLGGSVNINASIIEQSLIVNYVEIIGLNGSIWQRDASSPLNIQPIIDALKPKDKKEKKQIELRINSVLIRKSSVTYDRWDAPYKPVEVMDFAHLAVRDLQADINIPRIAKDDYKVSLSRLAFRERCGADFALSTDFALNDSALSVNGLEVRLDDSNLRFSDVSIPIKSVKNLGEELKNARFEVEVTEGSSVAVADMRYFVPALGKSRLTIGLDAAVSGRLDMCSIDRLRLDIGDKGEYVTALAEVSAPGMNREDMSIGLSDLRCYVKSSTVVETVELLVPVNRQLRDILAHIEYVDAHMQGRYTPDGAELHCDLSAAPGSLSIDGSARGKLVSQSGELVLTVRTPDLAVGAVAPARASLGNGSFSVDCNAVLHRGKLQKADFQADIDRLEWRNHIWQSVAFNGAYNGNELEAEITSRDTEAMFTAKASAVVSRDFRRFSDVDVYVDADNIHLSLFTQHSPWKDYAASFDLSASTETVDITAMDARAGIEDLVLTPIGGELAAVNLGDIDVEMRNSAKPMWMSLISNVADASVRGEYDLSTVSTDILHCLHRLWPSLISCREDSEPKYSHGLNNEFALDLTIKDTRSLEQLVKLPVSVIHPVNVAGYVKSAGGIVVVDIDAPYLLQGKKIVENTVVNVAVNGDAGTSYLYATTSMPTKNGQLSLTLNGEGVTDMMDTSMSWAVDSKKALNGRLDLTARASRDEDNNVTGSVDVHKSSMTLNDTVWTIHPTRIDIAKDRYTITDWRIGNDVQYVSIDGVVGRDPEDEVDVSLSHINLDYVFDVLNINNVDFGGVATGDVRAKDLLSGIPQAHTDNLDVKNLSYNDCVFGDAVIKSSWDHERQCITLDADITRANGGGSMVDGVIWPVKDGGGLDLAFTADRTGIGFLQPFMSAFCSKVDGIVSGNARLFGSFSDLDLEGDAYVEGMKLTIPFTNTTYTASDSLHFRPGVIDINDLTLHDAYGNTAKFRGHLTHRYFHDPVFSFYLYDAHDFLGYDIPDNGDQAWYGKVFVDGGASIIGKPGQVDINVVASTAPNSTFGFVLSDNLQAGEYTFVKFRDRDKLQQTDTLSLSPVERIKRLLASRITDDESSTDFNINISVDANPNVEVTLVMDPIAGDRIRAWGTGNMRMTYASRNDDMQLFGTYTLDRGTYNFTLQEIIVKDFTIDPGSSISFHGNPYAAQLNITAAYQTTANLSDLDVAFNTDKDLARTSVPVRALLKIAGDMRQPELTFDLEFPTLSSDIDRKVRSIVNTNDMLSRQVIYLLALNRFYTPEYANSGTNHGSSEFASLASTTLSSRLSSLLGTISDKWTIAPSVRSDNGDFSDMEVDLALSSHLLNNRLLINGNLGYRDKTLNPTSFVGDFDVEYLLNRSGTIRLKAYNRFNDQIFSARNALTTQGVGVVWKLDFDNLDSWIKRLRRRLAKTKPVDTAVDAAPHDSVAVGGGN